MKACLRLVPHARGGEFPFFDRARSAADRGDARAGRADGRADGVVYAHAVRRHAHAFARRRNRSDRGFQQRFARVLHHQLRGRRPLGREHARESGLRAEGLHGVRQIPLAGRLVRPADVGPAGADAPDRAAYLPCTGSRADPGSAGSDLHPDRPGRDGSEDDRDDVLAVPAVGRPAGRGDEPARYAAWPSTPWRRGPCCSDISDSIPWVSPGRPGDRTSASSSR